MNKSVWLCLVVLSCQSLFGSDQGAESRKGWMGHLQAFMVKSTNSVVRNFRGLGAWRREGSAASSSRSDKSVEKELAVEPEEEVHLPESSRGLTIPESEASESDSYYSAVSEDSSEAEGALEGEEELATERFGGGVLGEGNSVDRASDTAVREMLSDAEEEDSAYFGDIENEEESSLASGIDQPNCEAGPSGVDRLTGVETPTSRGSQEPGSTQSVSAHEGFEAAAHQENVEAERRSRPMYNRTVRRRYTKPLVATIASTLFVGFAYWMGWFGKLRSFWNRLWCKITGADKLSPKPMVRL